MANLSDMPPEELAQEATALANDKGRSVYLYHDNTNWYIGTSLGDIPSHARILEIKPTTYNNETNYTGGC